MAKQSGLAQKLYVDGFDLSGDVGAINNASSPRNLMDDTGIDKSGMERLNLLSDGQMEFLAFFNKAALREHVVLSALPTVDRVCLWALGQSVDSPAAGLVAKQMNYDFSRPADGSITETIQMLANGTPLEWLEMLSAGTITHASATSSASKDDAAGTSNGLIAYLEVVDLGSGTVTVTIEESSDDGAGDAFTTILSFTAVVDGTEPFAERVAITGAVERYLRITTTGTFTDADFAVAYRRGLAVDDVDLS